MNLRIETRGVRGGHLVQSLCIYESRAKLGLVRGNRKAGYLVSRISLRFPIF